MADKQNEWTPTNPDFDPDKPMQVGGQAVIEGVMMRSPKGVATAVRRANGDIVVQQLNHTAITDRFKVLALPIIRGAAGLIDMMYLGIKTLNWSAEIAMQDEDAKNNGNGEMRKKKNAANTTFVTMITLIAALMIGVGLFFILPLFVASKIFAIEQTAVSFNLAAGGIRIALLLGYMALISVMDDVKRLFQYHGAEHKSVFAFELKSELIPSAVKKFSRFHPRCGTSFLLIVAFVAILSFSLIDALWIVFVGKITLATRLFVHLPFIPVVGGLAYEVIKFSAKHSTTRWGKILIAPGLWLQKITTKEPDERQIEVALVALRCALGDVDASAYSEHRENAPVAAARYERS